ncbi:MAG: class I adenylate-forming enzyme family protein [Planctomycetota bacterium]
MLLYDYLFISAERFPNKIAIATETERVGYGDLLAMARAIAEAMKDAGLVAGDRVILYLDNSSEYVAAYFGVLLAGGVVVGQSTGNREKQLKHFIHHCRAAGVVCSGRHIHPVGNLLPECPSLKFLVYNGERAHMPETGPVVALTFQEGVGRAKGCGSQPVPRKPDDPAQIIYTSGTTAQPKGVMLSHKNLCANTESIIQYLELNHRDSVMAVLPFYYSYGNSLLLTHIACAGTLALDNRFAYPEKVLERIRAESITGFAGVPSTFAILVHKAGLKSHDLSCLRYITQAGGPMAPALAQELREALPKTKIFIMYGQTEASARLSYLEPQMLTVKSGSIGKAIPGVTLRLKDREGRDAAPGEVGEIVAQGDNIMLGYWENPEETAKALREDGLHTGDLATLDSDGYFFIVSRKSDMIKSGAHRISPKEIEEVIMEDQRVHEVAVLGEPDPILGETIVAVVVPKPGAEIDARDISMLCKRELPPYKVPKKIEFSESLPKTASGKIRRNDLRKAKERI